MVEINELKYRFGQKYQLPESSIDESLIPLFIATENLENVVHQSLTESSKINSELTHNIRNSIKSIQYDNPKTAFIGNLSIYAIPILIICVTVIILWWGWVFKSTQNAKFENLERLSKIVIVKDSVYFVPKESLKFTRKGVILLEK
ncbi:hypothetical protein [Emticicia sp. SJ17W-69]|uniref:hypothetical protein n=1 Tax=Emticicia sp. SJ17W-69 TaxID=3421657 RepID=UPI003EB8521A